MKHIEEGAKLVEGRIKIKYNENIPQNTPAVRILGIKRPLNGKNKEYK